MRLFRFVVVLTAALPAGCAALIAGVGTDTSQFVTRDQVRAEFGRPDAAGETDDQPYDQFHTRRKIADKVQQSRNAMATGMTLGLYEFIALPSELALVGGRLWGGQDLRFEYDASGRVVRVLLDGEVPELPLNRQH